MSISKSNRLLGCLLGGALGDAIGLFTEFFPADQCKRVYGSSPRFTIIPSSHPLYIKGTKACHMDQHRARFEEGAWTDDTDQTLLILLSFLRSGGHGVDTIDFAKRIRIWIQEGLKALNRPPLGIGRTVGAVVSSEGFPDNPVAVSRKRWEDTGRHLAANGAVMRTCVIGALLCKSTATETPQERVFRTAIDIASTTHADPRCLVSCAIASGLVCAMMNDEIHTRADMQPIVEAAIKYQNVHYPNSQLTAEHASELHTYLADNISLVELQLDVHAEIGYTYKALGAGVWALRQALSSLSLEQQRLNNPKTKAKEDAITIFERLITQITMAGGDADTNCAVAGPLLGALLGKNGLPKHWLEGLKHREWLEQKGLAACSLLQIPVQQPKRGDAETTLIDLHATVPGTGSESELEALIPTYDYENDQDTLPDAGKPDMTKEEVDRMAMKVMESMYKRMGTELPKVPAKKGEKDGCLII